MKKLIAGFFMIFALVTGAARADNIQFQPWLSVGGTGCDLAINYTDSNFPSSPYPSGNWIAVQTTDGDYLHTVNVEIQTASFTYTNCTNKALYVLLPAEATIGQGFYCHTAQYQGFADTTKPYIEGRTQKNPNHLEFYLSGPGQTNRIALLSDIPSGSSIKIRLLCSWIATTPTPVGLPNMYRLYTGAAYVNELTSTPPPNQCIGASHDPIIPQGSNC